MNLASASTEIARWIQEGLRQYVCVTGVHGIIESQSDSSLRRIHNAAGLVTPDGMPLVWLNWLRGKNNVNRVYGPDLILEICRRSEPVGWKHFFYGTTDETLAALTERLSSTFPKLVVVGTFSPPFRELRPDETANVASVINLSQADIVWVGLSTPKQERWMNSFRGKLNASVLIGVGAAFDFHAGRVRQAPRWIQRSGMEWAYRLCAEPRRLWRRYLRNNPTFLFLITAQLLGLRHWPEDEKESSTILNH